MTSTAASAAASAESAWAERYAGSARDVYRRTLIDLAASDPRVWCCDTDMGGLEDGFARRHPGQYVDLGIAEANMISVAAALAASGKIPFANTMASFAALRAGEQVKIDVAYNNLPVHIVATHSGLSAGHLGPTHHALEDLAVMRSLPNMTVLVPGDAAMTAQAVTVAAGLPGPSYIRLGRQATPLIYPPGAVFVAGRAAVLRDGGDVALVACGAHPVLAALAAHDRLAAVGISARVLDMATLKPLDVAALVDAATQTAGVVTVEEHSIMGGLGGAVAEVLAEHAPAPMRRIGVRDRFCTDVGSHDELLEKCGITDLAVAQAAVAVCEGPPSRRRMIFGVMHSANGAAVTQL
jgi:transketolase